MSVESFEMKTMKRNGSFRRREGVNYRTRKVDQILRDIDEARSYGIHLHALTLTDLYSYLNDARRQRKAFLKGSPKGTFKYDPMEDEQPPSDDGLGELERRIRKQTQKRSSRKRRTRTKTRPSAH